MVTTRRTSTTWINSLMGASQRGIRQRQNDQKYVQWAGSLNLPQSNGRSQTCSRVPVTQRIAAGEGTEEGTEIDTVQCIFDPKFDNLITGAILDVETDPKSYS